MKILVFGNTDFQKDSIALKIMPSLRKHFPEIDFRIQNSLDEITLTRRDCILDSAIGISEVTFFSDLKQLKRSSSSTLHDFDISFELQFLKKIGEIKSVKIIAIPSYFDKKKALKEVSKLIRSKLLRGNSLHSSYKGRMLL